MFSSVLRKFTLSACLGLAVYNYFSSKKWILLPVPLFNRVHCLQTSRVNKPEIIKQLHDSKEQMIILIYNRESEQQLKNEILKYEEEAQRLGIRKVLLVDQTDIRHLETFTRILREDIDEDDKKQVRQPVNLEGKIRVMYANPTFDGNKPFAIESVQTLADQVKEVRGYLKINPSQQELRKSIEKFNNTTVIKNCYNQTCVDEYKEKIRQLIDLELLRDKSDNYAFYVTNSKNEAARMAGLIGQTSNKQEIYVFKNDMLGKSRQLYTEFLQKEGANYQNSNKFMMMIRPRVHILSRKSMNTDLFWFVSTLRTNPVPTFSINNTMNNFPVKVSQIPGQKNKGGTVVWLKGHPDQVSLIRTIKQRYGNSIQILILETNVASELIRHAYQPERYCIFNLSPEVPYPKLLIRPPSLTVNFNSWSNMVKIRQQDIKLPDHKETVEMSDQKWARVLESINKFMVKPAMYSSIKILSEKELQINAEKLKQLLINSKQGKSAEKWIFRICGPINNCLYSSYEKYGIQVYTRVYRLDGTVQNVDIEEGDYEVNGDFIKNLKQ